jgi:hypothetical protein
MNLDDYISFILSILDNLIIKILNQDNHNFNKYDKIITIIINKIILMFLILKKIKKNRKKLLEIKVELTKLNDLQKNNKK